MRIMIDKPLTGDVFNVLRVSRFNNIVNKEGSRQDSVGKANLPATRKIIVRKYAKDLKP